MPSTLAQLEARVAARLGDPTNSVYSTATLDEGIRSALAEYNSVLPLSIETAFTLPGTGREIALNGLTGLIGVTAVWWPYDTTPAAEVWPPVEAQGFRVYWDDASPVLMLTSKTGSQPQLGDELRLWYTKLHTIQNLDSGSTTTVFGPHESGIVTGAAGYCALAQEVAQIGTVRLDKMEVPDLEKWGNARLAEFRAWLVTIKASAPSLGEPYGAGWSLDKWQENRR
jgi:hypothetical protein